MAFCTLTAVASVLGVPTKSPASSEESGVAEQSPAREAKSIGSDFVFPGESEEEFSDEVIRNRRNITFLDDSNQNTFEDDDRSKEENLENGLRFREEDADEKANLQEQEELKLLDIEEE